MLIESILVVGLVIGIPIFVSLLIHRENKFIKTGLESPEIYTNLSTYFYSKPITILIYSIILIYGCYYVVSQVTLLRMKFIISFFVPLILFTVFISFYVGGDIAKWEKDVAIPYRENLPLQSVPVTNLKLISDRETPEKYHVSFSYMYDGKEENYKGITSNFRILENGKTPYVEFKQQSKDISYSYPGGVFDLTVYAADQDFVLTVKEPSRHNYLSLILGTIVFVSMIGIVLGRNRSIRQLGETEQSETVINEGKNEGDEEMKPSLEGNKRIIR